MPEEAEVKRLIIKGIRKTIRTRKSLSGLKFMNLEKNGSNYKKGEKLKNERNHTSYTKHHFKKSGQPIRYSMVIVSSLVVSSSILIIP